MSDIKAGDLVMVVRPTPCCNDTQFIAHIFTAQSVRDARAYCGMCGKRHPGVTAIIDSGEMFFIRSTVRKIDPPAEGDSLPTRKDIEVPA